MRKVISIILMTMLIFNSSIVVFADETSDIYQDVSSFKEFKDKAIKEGKVISKEKFESILEKYSDDPTKLKKVLSKYAVTSTVVEYRCNEDSLTELRVRMIPSEPTSPALGDQRITTDNYYVYEEELEDDYTVPYSSGMNYSTLLGFTSFLPAQYGVFFNVISIFDSIFSSSARASAENIHENALYDMKVDIKFAEYYTEYGWYVGAKADKAIWNGYILVSYYDQYNEHHSGTTEIGLLQRATADHYNDNTYLLSKAIYGQPYTYIYNYQDGTYEYFSPSL